MVHSGPSEGSSFCCPWEAEARDTKGPSAVLHRAGKELRAGIPHAAQ